jgi:hypothetical protein
MSSLDVTMNDHGSVPSVRPKRRRRRQPKLIDGRSAAARRSRDLAAQFEHELGEDNPTPSRRMAIKRAASLAVLADSLRSRRLAGDQNVLLDDLVRVERLADRAVRGLGIDRKREPPAPTLKDYVAAKRAEPKGDAA